MSVGGGLTLFWFIKGIAYGVTHGGDGWLKRMENFYVLQGINPADIVQGRLEGALPANTITVPWSYLLSGIFYPSFLSWRRAAVWCAACAVLFALCCLALMYTRLRAEYQNREIAIFLCLTFFAQYGWYCALNKLNNGMFCTTAIMLSLLILEYGKRTRGNEYLVGILMSIATLKPQMALLFFIPILYRRCYRSILTTGVILIALWGAAAAITRVSPLTMLIEQLEIGKGLTSEVSSYYGILDYLTVLGVSSSLVLLIQFAIFVPLTFVLCWRCRRHSLWVQFAIPATFTLLWCYQHNSDIEIIGILMVAAAGMLLQGQIRSKKQRLFIAALYLMNLVPILYTVYYRYPVVPIAQRLFYAAGLCIVLHNAGNPRKICPAASPEEIANGAVSG